MSYHDTLRQYWFFMPKFSHRQRERLQFILFFLFALVAECRFYFTKKGGKLSLVETYTGGNIDFHWLLIYLKNKLGIRCHIDPHATKLQMRHLWKRSFCMVYYPKGFFKFDVYKVCYFHWILARYLLEKDTFMSAIFILLSLLFDKVGRK